MRTVLITGTSSGFGKDLVPAFLADGWRVIATMRNASERPEVLAWERMTYKDQLEVWDLDVTRSHDIARVSQQVGERLGGSLDCLVNNAGSGMYGALEDLTETQIRRQMEVNFFGVALLTRALMPALRRARGRVITLSSVLGYVGMPLSSVYCSSKFAVEGLMECLREEAKPFGVQVGLVEPGGFQTGFRANTEWGEMSFKEASPYRALTVNFRDFKDGLVPGRPTKTDPVIQAVLSQAKARRVKLRIRCGQDARLAYLLRKWLPDWLWERVFTFINQRSLKG